MVNRSATSISGEESRHSHAARRIWLEGGKTRAINHAEMEQASSPELGSLDSQETKNVLVSLSLAADKWFSHGAQFGDVMLQIGMIYCTFLHL